MCGIIGEIRRKGRVDAERLGRLRDILAHRGPDGAGLWVSPDGSAALGHRRLALVDLSDSGRQPMGNETGNLWLTFNGEIYNHKQLRAELTARGHRFSSTTDSEVLLHGFEEWGRAVLDRVKGMFAFAIYDNDSGALFLARDRFGIKPLYYHAGRDFFIFASELKAIRAHPEVPQDIDYSSVCDFFTYRYVPSPKSILKAVKKLAPAHCLTLSRDFSVNGGRYYELKSGRLSPPEKEAVERVDSLLADSVKYHVDADVKVGSFLSGGYDSSAILLYQKRAGYEPVAFALGFEGWEKSEHFAARMVAKHLGASLETKMIGPESLSLLSTLAEVYDEPLADISTVPTYEISRVASQRVKAVVSGEGADEIFGGYGWHRTIYDDWRGLGRLKRAALSQGQLGRGWFVNRYAQAMAMGRYDEKSLKSLIHPDLKKFVPADSDWFYRQNLPTGAGAVRNFQLADIRCFMGELVLTKIDRASMAHSLEVRVPFLDHELVEYALSLDETLAYKPDSPKFLLRENIKDALPRAIMNRKKQGFVGPDSYYADISFYREGLREALSVRDGIIRQRAVDELLFQGDHWRLWKVLVFENWYRRWRGNDG